MGSRSSQARGSGRAHRRLLALLIILLMIAAVLPAAADSAPGLEARSGSPTIGWTQFHGDGGNTLRSGAEGTSTPGVRWLRDFEQPTPAEQQLAPDGYTLLHAATDGVAPISDEGMVVMFATNVERRATIGGADARHELIGVDAVSGEVRWEIPNVGYDGQGPLQGVTGSSTSSAYCVPAVDSQGRLWVAHTPSGGDPEGPGFVVIDPHVMAHDLQTGQPLPGTRFSIPRPACRGAGALQIGGQGANERLIITAYPDGDRDTHDGFLGAGADGSVLAIDISGATPTRAWQLDQTLAAGPAPTFDVLLGTGPIPWGLWQGSPGFSRPVAAVDDTSVFIAVGTAAAGGGYDVELRQLALADGSELGRAAMPYPALSPTDTRSSQDAGLEPTDPSSYFSYQLLTDGSSLVVGSHTGGRLHAGSITGGLGFLAAFDLAGGLSDPPRWMVEGDPYNDGSLDGRSRGNFGTLTLGDGVVITQPRAERNPNTGALTYDGVGGFIARSLATGEIAWQTPNVRYLNRHGRTPMDAAGALYTVVPDTWGRSFAIKLDAAGQHEWAVTEWTLVDAGAQPILEEGTSGFLYRASASFVGGDGTVYLEGPRGDSTMLALDASNDVGVFAPAAPTGVNARDNEGAGFDLYSVEVSWDAAADPRRSVNAYTVTAEPGGQTCTTRRSTGQDMALPPETSCVVRVSNNTRNTFTVVASNPVGEGPASAPSNPVVFGEPPDEPDPVPDPVPDPDPTFSFVDVDPSNVHYAGIMAVAAAEITTGYPDGTFRPGVSVTRDQMATFLTRALNLSAGPDRGFTDVDPNNVHAPAINAVAAAGITAGCTLSEYCPSQPVTRDQMATFLTRALELSAGPDPGFGDVDQSGVHAPGINAVAAAGITSGCTPTAYCPSNEVTRAQMATFLDRAVLEVRAVSTVP